jgi:ribosome-binding protein aMBF1 (putative translation factor)
MATEKYDLDRKSWLGYDVYMISPEQCRAARAWLGWPQPELAKRAKVGLSTVRDFETGTRTPIQNNRGAIQQALEGAGIRFLFDGEQATGLEVNPASERPHTS